MTAKWERGAAPPRGRFALLSTIAMVLCAAPGHAEIYYVDLFRGSAEGDGSRSAPWLDLQRVLDEEPLEPGDEIYLGGGEWGVLTLEGVEFDPPGLHLTSFPPETPKLDGVDIKNSRGLDLSVMIVRPGGTERDTLVTIDAASSDISIEEFDIFSADTTEGWSREDWRKRTVHGIRSDGSNVRISGNWLEKVKHGISSTGPNAVIEVNIISQFTGDGIRVLGDGSVVEGNDIFNCLDVSQNHDDGIQSWSLGEDGTPGEGVVRDVTIRGNFIFERRAPFVEYPCQLQGIGLFDGFFDGWTIENNVIHASAWHGITMMGARDGVIRNNTVMGVEAAPVGPPWISVTRHKDGRPSSNMRIVNNLMPDRTTPPSSPFEPDQPGVNWINNFHVAEPAFIFTDPERLDFSLMEGSPAIGAALPDDTPERDITGRLRQGAADLGAFDAP